MIESGLLAEMWVYPWKRFVRIRQLPSLVIVWNAVWLDQLTVLTQSADTALEAIEVPGYNAKSIAIGHLFASHKAQM